MFEDVVHEFDLDISLRDAGCDGELTAAVSYTHLTAADERSSVDLGGRRIIKKKTQNNNRCYRVSVTYKTKVKAAKS